MLYNNYLRHKGEAITEVGACERIEGFDQIGEMVHHGPGAADALAALQPGDLSENL